WFQVRIAFLAGELLIEPAAFIFAGLRCERAMHFPIGARDKILNSLFAFYQDRERRRLDAANGREKETTGFRVESSHGAGAIDADQPIGLGTADGSVGERQHRSIVTQVSEPL